MKRKLVLLFIAIAMPVALVFADYLIVSRSATIRQDDNSGSRILDRTKKGDVLIMLHEQTEKGYYYAHNPNTGINGYIYRTLVRRYRGLPEGYDQNYIERMSGEDLKIHIVDVGGGQCNIIQIPGSESNGNIDRYILYDAGHYRGYGKSSLKQINEVIPIGSTIDLMVLSHTDADHIGAAGYVLKQYHVKTLLRTGYEKGMLPGEKTTATYKRLTSALEEINYTINDVNLNDLDSMIYPSSKNSEFNFGNARIQLLCGFGEPLPAWGLTDKSKKINSVSIVMKLEYNGVSVLFAGDAVGRKEKPFKALIATEKYLIDSAAALLASDVLIAPHHGANNGTSSAFLDAVSPSDVIFSAGHAHEHPRDSTAQRILKKISADRIYRTDRGDDERKVGKPDKEWSEGRIPGCDDSYGDDDILISISVNGTYTIKYKQENPPCDSEN